MMPEVGEEDEKQSVSYQAMYEGAPSQSKLTDTEFSTELRYWIVLALFICSLIIYRTFLPPLQCDTKFH
ncbi:unnamed protein product [Litomosoides sigmodontis]|uniref:Uncharacterized protein n=1 Tax=Litomosoides sigmodontis TaxID=42156 RepID=A0A3P7JM22_LITSI|nr:unnamed protein product [Litomosoides sigmodontis]